jgi:hypothetical protein
MRVAQDRTGQDSTSQRHDHAFQSSNSEVISILPQKPGVPLSKGSSSSASYFSRMLIRIMNCAWSRMIQAGRDDGKADESGSADPCYIHGYVHKIFAITASPRATQMQAEL